jgi:hypothetical protein
VFIFEYVIPSLLGLIGLFIAWRGGKRIIDGLFDKQVIALGTYYAKLRVYLLRLKQILYSNIKVNNQETKPEFNCALYSFSIDFVICGINHKDEVFAQEKKDLSAFSSKFLDFLSTEDNQVPHFTKNKEGKKDYEKWCKNQTGLVKHLTSLEDLNSGITLDILQLTKEEKEKKTADEHKIILNEKIKKYLYNEVSQDNNDEKGIINYINEMVNYIDKLPQNLFSSLK